MISPAIPTIESIEGHAPVAVMNTLRMMVNTMARSRFITTPASDTISSSRLLFLKLRGSISTGMPQPNPTKRRAMKPIGSMCAKGFSVTLPCSLGVGSPSLSATKAWANSWKASPITMPGRIRSFVMNHPAGSDNICLDA